MKKALVTILQYVIFLGLGIWIIYHMLHELSPKETADLIDAIKSVNLWYIIPIFIICFLSHVFRAMRWRLLLETLKGHPHPSAINTLFAVLIGYVTNLALPRAGEVAKCTVLARYEKVPAHKMVGTIVAERAFDVLCLIIIAIASFMLQAHVIGSFATDLSHKIEGKIIKSEHLLLIIFIVLAILITATIIIYRRNRETAVGRFIKEMAHGILSIIHMKKRWEFIGYTFLIWLTYILQVYLGFMSMPATHHLSILAALVVLVFGSVGLIVTPGGIGAYPLFVGQILTFYAISSVQAQAFGWIAWAAQTGIIFILGMLSLILLPIYNHRRNAQAAVDTE